MKSKIFIFIIFILILTLIGILFGFLWFETQEQNKILVQEKVVVQDQYKNLSDKIHVEEKNNLIFEDKEEKEIENQENIEVQENIENSIYEEPVIETFSYQPEYTSNENLNFENSSGLTPQSGVNYYNGRTETYYSSNVLYHYRTNEWTVDNEGFYRTDEGYYVVAASDMDQGTIFETSKGTAIVLDCGCSEGVTDFYVQW